MILSHGRMQHHVWFLVGNVWFLTYEESHPIHGSVCGAWGWDQNGTYEGKGLFWVQDDKECFMLLYVIMANEHE